jgi:nucleotide-binding universal stress UspA family protein
MTIKKILVPVTDPEAAASPLAAAFTVAGQFDAHVEVLHVRADPRNEIMAYVGEDMSGPMVQEVLEVAESRAADLAERAHKSFEDACALAQVPIAKSAPGPGGVSASWHEETGYAENWIEHCGRLADLTVIQRPTAIEDIVTRRAVETAILGTGRPLLVTPSSAPATIGGNVAIAWNGSSEAAHCVGAAMPFLDKASSVTVLSADKGQTSGPDSAELVDYLSWHGIKAKAAAVAVKGGSTGNALLAEASNAGADLVVMGAYTHSRMREMIMGGVTRRVLDEAGIPVLMAH